jgi:flagellar basal-body rod protein FlgC
MGVLTMISLSPSISGIKAALKAYDTSAHNTANINTDGFKKDTVRFSEGEYGVVASIEKSSSAGQKYRDSYGNIAELSNTDPVEETIEQMNARRMLAYNAVALNTADETEKSLLDIFA